MHKIVPARHPEAPARHPEAKPKDLRLFFRWPGAPGLDSETWETTANAGAPGFETGEAITRRIELTVHRGSWKPEAAFRFHASCRVPQVSIPRPGKRLPDKSNP